MPWTESGLYAATLTQALTAATAPNWNLTTNKFYLTNNSDTPDFTQVAASAIYSVTNEVSGTGWLAGGVLVSAAAAGSTSMVPTLGNGATKIDTWTMTNALSVASTTLTNAYGGFFYVDSLSPKAKFVGIYFGGSPYSTVSGTFAITWNGSGIVAITCAA